MAARTVERTLTQTIWNTYRDEVRRLWLPEDGSKGMELAEMRAHFRQTHAFNPTEKQWKNQLRRWNLRKNLTVRSAAAILSCIRAAQRSGNTGRAYLSGREVTEQDIARYMRKMRRRGSQQHIPEADLLGLVPSETDWPNEVLFVPSQVSRPQQGRASQSTTITMETADDPGSADLPTDQPAQDLHSLLPEPTWNNLNMIGDQYDRNDEVARYELNLADFGLIEPTWNMADETLYAEGRGEAYEATANVEFNGGMEPLWVGLEGDPMATEAPMLPFEGLDNLEPDDIAFYASSHPMPLALVAEAREGSAERISPADDNDGDAPVARKALRRCDELCIWSNYQDEEQLRTRYEQALLDVVEAVQHVASSHPEETLPLINEMRFHFQYYGQDEVAVTTFQALRNNVIAPQSHSGRILCNVLDFWIDLSDWSTEKLPAWRVEIAETHAMLLETEDELSKPSLALHYISAWISLVLDDNDAALSTLSQYQYICEHVFGSKSYHSIAWWRALARALYMKKWIQPAETIFQQLVIPSVEKHYGKSHPLHWEVTYLHGVLKAIAADRNFDPPNREQLWTDAIDLLKETLLWRGRVLGRLNPKTALVFRWCRRYMEISGRQDQADGLWEWFDSECS